MAAKKKSATKGGTKVKTKAAAKAKKTKGGEGGGQRGRKPVLVGEVDTEQKKRIRRALRAANFNLKDLGEGETVTATTKGDMIVMAHKGKKIVEIPVVARERKAVE